MLERQNLLHNINSTWNFFSFIFDLNGNQRELTDNKNAKWILIASADWIVCHQRQIRLRCTPMLSNICCVFMCVLYIYMYCNRVIGIPTSVGCSAYGTNIILIFNFIVVLYLISFSSPIILIH